MPFWWLLRYYDTINNPADASPKNLTLLEKIVMLDKEIEDLKTRLEKLENQGSGENG